MINTLVPDDQDSAVQLKPTYPVEPGPSVIMTMAAPTSTPSPDPIGSLGRDEDKEPLVSFLRAILGYNEPPNVPTAAQREVHVIAKVWLHSRHEERPAILERWMNVRFNSCAPRLKPQQTSANQGLSRTTNSHYGQKFSGNEKKANNFKKY